MEERDILPSVSAHQIPSSNNTAASAVLPCKGDDIVRRPRPGVTDLWMQASRQHDAFALATCWSLVRFRVALESLSDSESARGGPTSLVDERGGEPRHGRDGDYRLSTLWRVLQESL